MFGGCFFYSLFMNLLGVIPNCFMKHWVKWDTLLNPRVSETCFIVVLFSFSIRAASFSLWSFIYSFGERDVTDFTFL